MNNFSLEPVFLTLQENVNITLGEFAKAFIEQNDYQMLAKIAEIGETTTAFFNDFSDVIHQEDSDDVDIIEEPTEPKQSVHSRKSPPSDYSVDETELKNWIYNYVGSRGGKTLKDDLANAFYNEFSSKFNTYDLTMSKDNKVKWKQNIAHRVGTLRKEEILEKSKPGETYHYYILTPEYLALYKAQVAKIEKQLSLPDLEITG